ncbi:MAG: universal stress protein [Bacteroidetes bacterium]|nr:universal stress protein [Bacteroidota bacterium]HET6243826.1 universal stress protein [Bacteroidia bacterium]
MKTILVPTDFSINAEKALEYALHLALYFSSEIILLHAWELPHQKSAMFKSLQDMVKEKAENNLRELKEKAQYRFTELKIRSVIMMDEPEDAIKSVAQKIGTDLIIMGTKGASGLKSYFFGSTTNDVIEDAPCPVFAVPEKAEYRNIKTICYALDFDHDEIHVIGSLIPMAKVFNAKIILTHITDNLKQKEEKLNNFAEQVIKLYQYNNIDTALLYGENIVASLVNFVEENQVDIVSIARKKRDFIERVFHKSVSKEMTFSSTIPIIIFQSSLLPLDVQGKNEEKSSFF